MIGENTVIVCVVGSAVWCEISVGVVIVAVGGGNSASVAHWANMLLLAVEVKNDNQLVITKWIA